MGEHDDDEQVTAANAGATGDQVVANAGATGDQGTGADTFPIAQTSKKRNRALNQKAFKLVDAVNSCEISLTRRGKNWKKSGTAKYPCTNAPRGNQS